jgi:tetratricopeptide (TPR) repeat protein
LRNLKRVLIVGGMVAGGLVLLLGLVAGILWWVFIAPRIPKADVLLSGARTVTSADLPPALQGLSDDALRQHLTDALTAITQGGPWWRADCSEEQAREAVLLGRLLHDNQALARGLLWFARGKEYHAPFGSYLPYLDSAVACAEGAGLAAEAGYGRICHGQQLASAGLYRRAAREFEQCAPPLEAAREYRLAAMAYSELGSVQGRRLGEEAAAVASYRRAAQLARQAGEPETYLVPIEALAGFNAESCGDFAAAEQAFTRSLALARTGGKPDRLYTALIRLASHYTDTAQPANTEPLFKEARALLPAVVSSTGISINAMEEARFLFRRGKYEAAQAQLSQVIALCTQQLGALKAGSRTRHPRFQLEGLAQAARVAQADYFLRAKDSAAAVRYAQQVVDHAKPEDYLNHESRALIIMAQALTAQGQAKAALAALDQAAGRSMVLKFAMAASDPQIELPRAQALIALGRYREAQAALDGLKSIGTSIPGYQAAQWQSQLQRTYGQLYAKLGRKLEALRAYEQAFTLLSGPAWREMWAGAIDPETLADFGATGAEYIALLRQVGDTANATYVEAVCAKAAAAQQFIRDGLPCTPAARTALWDYLGALTTEQTLREHWRETAQRLPPPQLWQMLTGPDPLPIMPSLWWPMWNEQRQLRHDLAARLQHAGARSAQALSALRRAHKDVAAFVDLQ